MKLCKICNIQFENNIKFSNHLKSHNITSKEYYDKFELKEREGFCKICNSETRFENGNIGYKTYCSSKCSSSDPDNVKKRINSNLIKYGVENPFQSEDIKNKIKLKNIKTFGVEHPLKNEEIKLKMIQTRIEKNGSGLNVQKFKQTCIDKYGVDNPNKVKEFKDKASETAIKRYGNKTNGSQISQTIKTKYIKQIQNTITKNNYTILSYELDEFNIQCDCGHCFKMNSKMIYARMMYNIKLCTICNPINNTISNVQSELKAFVVSLIPNLEVLESFKLKNKQELDIYIPQLNIAFEFNGCYWHSSIFKDRMYHVNKLTYSNEQGIKLIYIDQSDWLHKQPIIKSMIKYLVNKIVDRLFARNCEFKIIDNEKDVIDFYNKNHIQGYTQCKINIALVHNECIVSMMSFSRSKFNKNYEWELTRFANLLGFVVVGSASKLFKYFINKYNPESIVSYSDLFWSSGGIYKVLNFNKAKQSSPSYYYVKKSDLSKHHRFKFRKDNLYKNSNNIGKTEDEIMLKDYFKIWDCGKIVWDWYR